MAERRHITTGSRFEHDLGYARAVVQGDWCFVAGTTGYDYATMTMPEDPVAQARNAFATVDRVLAEAGFARTDIVKVTHVLTRRDLVPVLTPVIGDYLRPAQPAATMIIAELMTEDMLYEIDVTAFRG
jgi:Putative translation initiation inhibitor, yjgF family